MNKYQQKLYDEMISRISQISVVAWSDNLPSVQDFITDTIECFDKLISTYEEK